MEPMRHKPLTRQTSPWVGRPEMTMTMQGPRGDFATQHWFERRVSDGSLRACVGHEPLGQDGELRWHLSISFRNHKGDFTRYPSWDEQVHALRELCPRGLTFAMFLPPDGDDYVGLHDTTFHWHEYRGEDG